MQQTILEGEPGAARRPVSAGGIAWGILLLLIADFHATATFIEDGFFVPLGPIVIAFAAGISAITLLAINFRRSGALLRCALALPLLAGLGTVANASFRLALFVWLLTAGSP